MNSREQTIAGLHFMAVMYAFDGFVLDPVRRRLIRSSGEAIAIQAKAFDALVCLIEHAGEVVPRAALAQALWPTTVMEDNNLSQTIRALRQALGDTGPEYRYVLTVPRRGYQFVAEVREQQRSAPPERITRRPLWLALALVTAIAALGPLFTKHETAARTSGPDRIVNTPTQPDWSHRPVKGAERAELRRRLGLQGT